MSYTDSQGRPEIVMHPAIKRGGAAFRLSTGGGAGPGAATDRAAPESTTVEGAPPAQAER